MKGKEYVRPVPATWWLQRPSWRRFMLRELTAVFVGGYAIFLLVLADRAQDELSFSALVEALKSPLSIALHLVALAMTVYHAVTWFNAMPQAISLWRGEKRVSPRLMIASNYVAWAVVSVLVVWMVLR